MTLLPWASVVASRCTPPRASTAWTRTWVDEGRFENIPHVLVSFIRSP